MSRTYDNWERLVEETLKREELRYTALYCDSFSSIASSSFSFDYFLYDVAGSLGNTTETEIPVLRYAQHIAFKELAAATKIFHSLIGSGSSGNVYKGWIDSHNLTAAKPGKGIAVAVKKSSPESFAGRDEWSSEVGYLRHLHHPNIVKLIGYSSKEDTVLVVYEFLSKGSLDNHLFRNEHEPLSWPTRIKVATGAARGLSFLHGLKKQIILRDIVPSNILLDREFNAKLTGFALCKDGPTGDATHVSTEVVGTHGYSAPEYVATGHLTARCDVYGFGVILLELLSGLPAIDTRRPAGQHNLVDWAKPFLSDKKKQWKIMDPKLEGQYPKKEVYSASVLASSCLCVDPRKRPQMTEVLAKLERLQDGGK